MKKSSIMIVMVLMTITITSAQDASDYYPMQVGNYWILSCDTLYGEYKPTIFRQDVEGIDLIHEKEYFRVKHTLINGGDWSSYFWFCIDSTGIILKAQGDTSTVDSATIYDTPLLFMPNEMFYSGFTWEWELPLFGFTYTYSVESLSENVQVPAGSFNNCIIIRTIMTDTLGNTMTQDAYHAKDVGEVLLIDSRMGRFELVEYFLQTGVKYEGAIKIPVRFSLKQNHPNPFNPATTIEFNLTRDSHVYLRIYDVTGKLVKTVLNEWKKAGYHSVVWDGKDNKGNAAASGLYFYRLENDRFNKTKQMLLLR